MRVVDDTEEQLRRRFAAAILLDAARMGDGGITADHCAHELRVRFGYSFGQMLEAAGTPMESLDSESLRSVVEAL